MKSFTFFTIILILLSCQESSAQREAANWYFGVNAGLDFNSGLPVALQNGKLQTIEGSATISDRNGNLLFIPMAAWYLTEIIRLCPMDLGSKEMFPVHNRP